MKRTFALVAAALVATALFGLFVYAVLMAAHVSEPSATTVQGLTPRRLWATMVAVLALIGVIIGGLASQALVRLELRDGKVTKEERYLGELGERIRDVEQGPDGFLYIVTDSSNGQVLRIVPAK